MAKPLAVITGASRGIGRATAVRLAPDYDILALARNRAELQLLAAEIAAAGGNCSVHALDLTDGDAVAAALSAVDAHVLINNAGVGTTRPFLELNRAEWRAMVDLNFNALFDVTRAVLPSMVARRSGHIINVGSISGRSAYVGGSCYAATKHAVMSFSECLMLEVRDAGVKVSIVNPGAVATGFSHRSDPSWMLDADDVAQAIAAVIATPPGVLIFNVELRTLTVPARKP